jgi:hypothetical protein
VTLDAERVADGTEPIEPDAGDEGPVTEVDDGASGDVDRTSATDGSPDVREHEVAPEQAEGPVRSGRGARARLRRAWRPRTAVIVVLAVAVGLAGTGYAAARVGLAHTRADLTDTRSALASVRDDLAVEQRRAELTEASVDQVRTDIDGEVAARTWLDAVVANTMTEIASVDAARAETDAARVLVAANSTDALACFGGVSGAIDASRRGDSGVAAQALGSAADQCSRALAFATGARFPYDFADPFVLPAGGAYYGYSTNSGAGDIQVIRSTDLVRWEMVGNALASVPFWAARGSTWAPAVLARGGGYVAYYTVRDTTSGNQCISSAVASSPAGPFRDDSWGPLVCQHEHGGSIDPSPFVDADGRAYLLWKAEGHGGSLQALWSQELTADGRGFVGTPSPLLSAGLAFERGVVEAPSMVLEGGTYVLAYAAADWNSRRYAAAYATCAGPLGPCSRPADGRVLTSGPRLAGPGGVELFRGHDGALWAAFHAFSEPNVGYPSSRYFHVARAHVRGGRLVIDAET